MTAVPAVGRSVTLGLPFEVDPTTGYLALHDAVVCATLPDGSGGTAQHAVVVPAPAVEDQGADLSQQVDCPAAPSGAECSATLQPIITVSNPQAGADELGLGVTLPVTLCVGGTCQSGDGELGSAVISGMLQCSDSPIGVNGLHRVCTWQGAEISVDGVPASTSAADLSSLDVSTGTVTIGAWNTQSVDIGLLVRLSDDCGLSSPTDCYVTTQDPWASVQELGGRALMLVVADRSALLTVPLATAACLKPHGSAHC